MKRSERKRGFILSDSVVGLTLICLGVITFAEAQLVMNRQLGQREERVLQLRQRYETQLREKNS
ncbi:hypothetical protein [Secundilactobacillus muriivasis]